jgi:NADPH-dependent glutamate synthase beta subunit-like oxidoreductase/coenzyme F420-reducing hydrogenase delta subunit
VNRGVLIIGSSLAGIQAAQDLADAGLSVHLVEPAPFLGNAGATTLPHHLLTTRILKLARHPRVRLYTNTDVIDAKGHVGELRVQLRQHPRFVDLQRCTGCGDCIDACPVTVPNSGNKAVYLPQGVQPECAVIEKFGKAPCSSACPGGIHVQGYVALIAQGRFQEAFDLIRDAIPFPGICGRICTHPCELNCRRADVDAAVAIRQLKRFVADWVLKNDEHRPSTRIKPQVPAANGKRVAVIGSGPAGMTVADRLSRRGYQITIFEKMPVLAGMLSVGIPAYRLPRGVIQQEYTHIQALGIDIHLNTEIGPNGRHTLADLLRNGYSAVCLAIGAHQSLRLGIPGENSAGVIDGIALLKTINLSQQLENSEHKAALRQFLGNGSKTRVAVLGGGNTALDVARSLKRLGLSDVTIVYRRSLTEMPALPEEVAESEEEGVDIQFLTAPVRIIADQNSGVCGLECIQMKLGQADETGRRRPVPIAGSEFQMDVDLVVLAIGQVPDLNLLGDDRNIAITRDRRIQVDGSTFATQRDGVFAVGDVVTTDHMSAIEAIGMGKKAAAAIDAYLQGMPSAQLTAASDNAVIAKRELTPEEKAPIPRTPMPVVPVDQRLTDFSEVELGFDPSQAIAEAQRCLVCGPCSECMACKQTCKAQAIVHEQAESIIDLDIGAIIVADDCQDGSHLQLPGKEGLYRILPQETLSGSAAAARVLSSLAVGKTESVSVFGVEADPHDALRIGAFICRCGDVIERVVDTDSLRQATATLPGVCWTEIIQQACLPEAGEMIRRRVSTHHLNRVIIAACACCSLEQVCFSCTHQRIRCKHNLGLFNHLSNKLQPTSDFGLVESMPPVVFEFVNIREHCAWVHADQPEAATAKASNMVAAAVEKLSAWSLRAVKPVGIDRSVLIVGNSPAADICCELLDTQDLRIDYTPQRPSRIWRTDAHYMASNDAKTWRAAAVVMAPEDAGEAKMMQSAFDIASSRKMMIDGSLTVDTRLPGVFFCDPDSDGTITGAAAAGRVAAWLGRASARPQPIAAWVDPNRCRACNTCVEVCEYGAPQLVGEEFTRHSWIDPMICSGCGTCAPLCPSNAIAAGYTTDEQMGAIIQTALNKKDMTKPIGTVIVFICNWNAYYGLEMAGRSHLQYSPAVYPIRVMCLGRLSPGIILKAFEQGAAGVLLLGCGPDECHYGFGNRHAEETVQMAGHLIELFGYSAKRLKMEQMIPGETDAWLEKVESFMAEVTGGQTVS